MSSANKSNEQPLWVATLLLVLSVLYLFPEVVFNAMLVETAGGIDATDEKLRVIELFGRASSGIGVVLLIAGLVLKSKFTQTKRTTIFTFGLLALMVWPTVFFGQKYLVDHYLIETSTVEQRQNAYFSQLLRLALARNTVEIEGVPYDSERKQTASDKTFLSLLGGLLYADTQMLDSLDKQKESIIRSYIKGRAYSEFDAHYEKYKVLRSDLRSSFKEYQKATKKYNKVLRSSSSRSNKYWLEVEQEIKNGWGDYKAAEKSFDIRVESRAKDLAPRVYAYIGKRNRFIERRDTKGLKKLEESYDKGIKDYGLGIIPVDYWGVPKDTFSDNFWKTAGMALITGGATLLVQGADMARGGKGGLKDDYLEYNNEVPHYSKLLRVKMLPKFKEDTGGFEYGIKSLSEFRKHQATSALVRNKLKKKGLLLPKSWKTSQRSVFNKAVVKKVKSEADLSWNAKMAKKNMSILPNLGWNKFQRNAGIQDRIRRTMGEENYVSPMLGDWNNEAFRVHVIEPNIERKTKEAISFLKAELPEYADGGYMEDKSKAALRANLVPPISMALSLFLIIFTVMKLPMNLVSVIKRHRGSMPETPKADDSGGQSRYWKYIKVGSPAALIGIIVVMPFFLFSNSYSKADSTVGYFLDRVEQETSASVSQALRWVLITQPQVQPIGGSLESSLNLVGKFKAIEPILERWDNNFFAPRVEANEVVNRKDGKLPLVIEAHPAHARIQILNIKPVYKRGMFLPVGDYKVLVSSFGYKSVRRTVHLKRGDTTFAISLQRM